MPSSSSMSATIGASGKPIGAGCRGMTQLATLPRPLSFTVSRLTLWQAGHIGRGGCVIFLQSAQRWPSNSPRAAPSQKKIASGVNTGSGRVGAGGICGSFDIYFFSAAAGACGCQGLRTLR